MWHPVNVSVLVDDREKMKEKELIDKYLELARELKSCGT